MHFGVLLFIDFNFVSSHTAFRTMERTATYSAGAEDGTDIDELIPDLPRGPLDRYRNQASFNWKTMKLYLDPPDVIAMMVS